MSTADASVSLLLRCIAPLGVALLACGAAGRTTGEAVPAPPPAPAAHSERRAALDALHAHETAVPEPAGDLREEARRRRRELARRLGPGVIWVQSAPADELQRFYQEDNFLYLTGVEQPDIAFALHVGEQGDVLDEVVFLPPHDPDWEVWNGPRLTPGAAAAEATGFSRTADLAQQEAELAALAPEILFTHGLVSIEDPPRALVNADTRVREALNALRHIKSEYEIACLKNAIAITGAGLRNALDEVRPGAYEHACQGALEGTFLRLGAERAGFASICGSGPNSCALHYNANGRRMEAGDLLVMDVGAKYRYYCADVTRTVPVSGSFSPRQREIYELVLAAQTAAAEQARPGMTLKDIDGIARKVIVDGGFGPDRDYFKHSVGHWLGLDVHDVAPRQAKLLPGTVFTIEPGIYIEDEDLGVRIEDDYLMTETGAVKLSTHVPSDPETLEALLQGRS